MGKPDIPQYGLFTDGYVHRKVLQYICGKEAYSGSLQYQNTCIYYNGVDRSDGWGFCDLINIDTGEIWELKKDSTSWSCTTEQARCRSNSCGSARDLPAQAQHRRSSPSSPSACPKGRSCTSPPSALRCSSVPQRRPEGSGHSSRSASHRRTVYSAKYTVFPHRRTRCPRRCPTTSCGLSSR